ncbi:MAG: polysaccharide deacetylase family protein [Sulfobacillus sp.]
MHRLLSLVLVLLFHAVGTPGAYTVSPATFRQDLIWLRQHQVQVLSLAQFEGYMKGTYQVTTPSVLIAFDDGNVSDFTQAAPILAAFHMPAVAFLIGSRIGEGPNSLSVSQVQAMAASGLWSFGAHTYDLHSLIDGMPSMQYAFTHHALSATVSQDVYQEAQTFAQLGLTQPTAFAYPFGFYNSQTNALLGRAYPFLFTSVPGFARPGQRLIPRVDIGIGFDSLLRLSGYVAAMDGYWASTQRSQDISRGDDGMPPIHRQLPIDHQVMRVT